MVNEEVVSIDDKRLLAESSLLEFIKLVHPHRVLGRVHKDLISWWTRKDAKSHQLVLLPRDHGKSAMVAYRAAWELTRNPTLRILYISSTANLAQKQLKFIKDILTCDTYRTYWPEMVNKYESDREKWTEFEISVDHPARKLESVRDPSIFTAGLTTGITGLHCDIAILDDVVVDDNAYSEEGRNKVRGQVSYLASIAGTDGKLWAVGTRYHPKDLYRDMLEQRYEEYDKDGNVTDMVTLYEFYERTVESNGDGTGVYLWPRMQRQPDGKWFGFNREILAKKKAQYHDTTRFRAQYYNDPNDISNSAIRPEMFQYYDRKFLTQSQGKTYFKQKRLNVFASMDFAYSVKKENDYTAIAVVGVDAENNYYVLDIDRFKTDLISDYYDRLLRLHMKWGFRKVRAEVTAGQVVIVNDLKQNYIRANGLGLVIEEYRPNSRQGNKQERILATLQPKYANRQIYHFAGGNCEHLEEELVLAHPPHDDLKDALASCVGICVAPSGSNNYMTPRKFENLGQIYHPRFGGVS